MKQIKSILINTICIVSLSGLMSCVKEIDLDDGVKHNYALFADVLAKIK